MKRCNVQYMAEDVVLHMCVIVKLKIQMSICNIVCLLVHVAILDKTFL